MTLAIDWLETFSRTRGKREAICATKEDFKNEVQVSRIRRAASNLTQSMGVTVLSPVAVPCLYPVQIVDRGIRAMEPATLTELAFYTLHLALFAAKDPELPWAIEFATQALEFEEFTSDEIAGALAKIASA